MLVTRLVCDREALNSLARVCVFSRALACHIRVAQEFHKVTNKKLARVMRKCQVVPYALPVILFSA